MVDIAMVWIPITSWRKWPLKTWKPEGLIDEILKGLSYVHNV